MTFNKRIYFLIQTLNVVFGIAFSKLVVSILECCQAIFDNDGWPTKNYDAL